jgi:hypothetical protein
VSIELIFFEEGGQNENLYEEVAHLCYHAVCSSLNTSECG